VQKKYFNPIAPSGHPLGLQSLFDVIQSLFDRTKFFKVNLGLQMVHQHAESVEIWRESR
jgi:hypothetical protein